jgi:hypothetical protein
MSRSAQLLKLPLLTTKTLKTVSNDDDMWAPSQADDSYDPFPDFVYLDPTDITQGLLMWISIGIDPSANYISDAVFAGSWDGETQLLMPTLWRIVGGQLVFQQVTECDVALWLSLSIYNISFNH